MLLPNPDRRILLLEHGYYLRLLVSYQSRGCNLDKVSTGSLKYIEHFMSPYNVTIRIYEDSMTPSKRTELGENLYNQLQEAWVKNSRNLHALSNADVDTLMDIFTIMWGDLSSEREKRYGVTAASEEPIWAAIRSGGIHISSKEVVMEGERRTIWFWSIPLLKKELSGNAGFGDKMLALQGAIRWLVTKVFYRRFWPF
jgi:hypothetical protein